MAPAVRNLGKYILIVVFFLFALYGVWCMFFPESLLDSYKIKHGTWSKVEMAIVMGQFFTGSVFCWMFAGVVSTCFRLGDTQAQNFTLLFMAAFFVQGTCKQMYLILGSSFKDDLPITYDQFLPNWIINAIFVILMLLGCDFKQLQPSISKSPLYWGHFVLILVCVVCALWDDIDQDSFFEACGIDKRHFPTNFALVQFYDYNSNGNAYGLALVSLGVIMAGDHRWTAAVNRWYACCEACFIAYSIASVEHLEDLGLTKMSESLKWWNIIYVVKFALWYVPLMWADTHPQQKLVQHIAHTEGWDSSSDE